MIGETRTVKMVRTTPIAWVDIETTGLEVETHTILSIGAVRSDGAEREWYVRPSMDAIGWAQPEALKVNGYTPELWEERGQQSPYTVAREFAAFVDGHIIGAHNAAFDWPFLMVFCRNDIVPLNVPHRPLCTVSMLWPFVISGELESPSHEMACKHFGIPLDGHHTALADARRAKALYEAVNRAWAAGVE
jgi:DNA polymerase-3 subunit epsilon